MENEVKKAVEILTTAIKEDEGLRIGYKSNIAMAFFDEAQRQKIEISVDKLHSISNESAENFLNNWCV